MSLSRQETRFVAFCSQWTLRLAFVLTLIPLQRLHGADHSTASVLEQFEIRDGYEIELVASEPLIMDPVSAQFDTFGRIWVVEMPDYPTGPRNGTDPAGRIRILSDQDNDGRFETATTFADKLLFVTGVQPYGDGAFVTLAGKIMHFRDRDGDGEADQRKVLFRGFATDNEQLRANHPSLGPDGLIYVANGLRGGKIESADSRYDASAGPIDLRLRDFRFDPEGGLWEAIAGNSQHGLTIDDFGRRIGCSNRNPAMYAPLPLAVAERDKLLAPRDVIADIAASAEQSSVRPIADAWTTSNLHAGQFSAACGVFAPGWRHGAAERLFVCEPTGSLVQRQSLSLVEGVWKSVRDAQASEFLAAGDNWFRPVDIFDGPDGCLYVVDMTRAVIEHPDWAPPELKQRGDTWDGAGLGRIWRVRPRSSPLTQSPKMSYDDRSLTSVQAAVEWLKSEIPNRRASGSQLLLEHGLGSVEPAVHELVANRKLAAATRARAAFLLHRFGKFLPRDADALCGSRHPRLRALAIELIREHTPLDARILNSAGDQSQLVRLEAAVAITSSSQDLDEQLPALLTIASRDIDAVWTRRALASAAPGLIAPFAKALLRELPKDEATEQLLHHLIRRLSGRSPKQAAGVLLSGLPASIQAESLERFHLSLLNAWQQGARLHSSGNRMLDRLSDRERRAIVSGTQAAVDIAVRQDRLVAERLLAIDIASRGGHVTKAFRGLLENDVPPSVRVAAVPVLLRHDADWALDHLQQALPDATFVLRQAVVKACLRKPEHTRWLLELIREEEFPKSLIDPASANRLREHPNRSVRQLAEKMFAPDADRVQVLRSYKAATQLTGDAKAGKQLFVKHCAACHHIDGVGTNVGPDISDSRTKTAEALLTSILDPNAAIDAAYLRYSILTTDGRRIDGLLLDETADELTLVQQGDERVSVSREEIEQLRAPGVSLMPEGFESAMTVAQMNDLVTYLKHWRYLDRDIPLSNLPQESD